MSVTAQSPEGIELIEPHLLMLGDQALILRGYPNKAILFVCYSD